MSSLKKKKKNLKPLQNRNTLCYEFELLQLFHIPLVIQNATKSNVFTSFSPLYQDLTVSLSCSFFFFLNSNLISKSNVRAFVNISPFF